MLTSKGLKKHFTEGTIVQIVKMKEDMNIHVLAFLSVTVQGNLWKKCTLAHTILRGLLSGLIISYHIYIALCTTVCCCGKHGCARLDLS